jgi:hypothetical protein
MSHRISTAFYLRLPADLRRWVAEEAIRARCSMNSIVVGAIESLRTVQDARLANDRHTAAIETAISLARLPRGTEIILRSDKNELRTQVLVRKPDQTRYAVLAEARGEEVVYSEEPAGTPPGGR